MYVGCSSEEVNDRRLVGVFIWVCAGVSLYVFSYRYLDVYDEDAEDFIVYVGSYVQDQTNNTGDMHSLNYK